MNRFIRSFIGIKSMTVRYSQEYFYLFYHIYVNNFHFFRKDIQNIKRKEEIWQVRRYVHRSDLIINVLIIIVLFFKDSKVFCSFCEEGFESSEFMMDHLMICGNKTDPCPNCGKYVRRAIFAYHYENNCANFDEPPTDNEKHNKSQSSSKLYPFLLLVCVYYRWNTRGCALSSLQ
jgi:hypothetical protein